MAGFTDLTFILGLPYDLGGDDVILAAQTTDYIIAYGGNDLVLGFGGNDVITDTYALNRAASGNDTIYGGAGHDTIITSLDGANEYYGGEGIDTLDITRVTGQTVIDLAGNSAGAYNGSLTRTTLVAFENVLGSVFRDEIYGNGSANVFDGYGGDDHLEARAGNDTLYGGNGDDALGGGDNDDLLHGDAGFDIMAGGAGIDRLFGGTGYDTLYGGQGNDQLDGDAGLDFFHGDMGRDILTGGSEADTFFYGLVAESRGSGADVITDFQRRLDKIDLRLVDANSNVAFDQSFKFIGDKAFTAAGQIKSHYNAATNSTLVSFNTDADAAAEMSINLTGKILLSSVDFIL